MALRFIPFPRAKASPRRGVRARRPGLLTLGLLTAILVLAWGSGWYVLRAVAHTKENDLGARLEALGSILRDNLRRDNVIRQGLNEVSLLAFHEDALPDAEERRNAFVRDFGDLGVSADLNQILQQFVRLTNLRSAMIVDVNGRAIADSAGRATPFEDFPYLAIDQKWIEDSSRTLTIQSTPYYRLKDGQNGGERDFRNSETRFKRSYTPLVDADFKVLEGDQEEEAPRPFAFLRLEASRDYFEAMDLISRQLLVLYGIITILLGCVAFIFHRLLRQVFDAEKIVAEADRLESVARLAAGFAHEVRNPLGIIRSCAEGLAEELEDANSDAVSLARDMVEEVVRVDSLITQFLHFARPAGTGPTRPVQVGEVLRAVAGLAGKDLQAKGLNIELRLEPSAPPVRANEKELRQVFLNCLLNAKDATPPGGSIVIETSGRKRQLLVSIRDSGSGISPKDLAQVFDPFFTTKSGGTGLGLSVSRSIVERVGGSIDISSQIGKGTTVDILLPADDRS